MYVCAHAINSLRNSNVNVWVGGGNRGVVCGRGMAWVLRFRLGLLDELYLVGSRVSLQSSQCRRKGKNYLKSK